MIPKHLTLGIQHDRERDKISSVVVESAAADVASLYRRLKTGPEGLVDEDAEARLLEHGPNVLGKDQRVGILTLFAHAVLNPLVLLLIVLASVSFATGDVRAGTMMSLMVALDAFQPGAQSDHQRHHRAGTHITGGE